MPVVSHEKANPGIAASAAMTAKFMKLCPMTEKVFENTLPMLKDLADADSMAMISPSNSSKREQRIAPDRRRVLNEGKPE
jgi:hypothetical protein